MAEVTYQNTFQGGQVLLPPSKSVAHRAMLCAALSRGRCLLSHMAGSQDIAATARAIQALGGRAMLDEAAGALLVEGQNIGSAPGGAIDCGESGSTLRFLIPIAAALGGTWTFTGSGRLPQRPLDVYRDLLPGHSVSYRDPGDASLPLTIAGQLTPGGYQVPGNISSQFITGLLLALPLLPGDSDILLTTPLESEGYVNLTLQAMAQFGVTALPTERGWHVPGNQSYRPQNAPVEGDWSQAAFFLAMAALAPGGEMVELSGLSPQSRQGDKACVELFQNFGLSIRWQGDRLLARNPHAGEPFHGLRGQAIDAAQIPDMVPALSVCAALSRGETRIYNAQRLRLKESDRLAAMEQALTALGGKVQATADGLVIQGVETLSGGLAQGANDHRVVMALAAAALGSRGPVTVTDAWSVRKSYPKFFTDFESLGGKAHVV